MKQVRIVVLKGFKDLQDENRIYQPGENYPFKGPVDPTRIKELASEDNRLGEPLLEFLEEEIDFSILGIVDQVLKEKIDSAPGFEAPKKTTKKKVVEEDEQRNR